MRLERVHYGDLNSRQKERYNFHKIAARLAEYGFDIEPAEDNLDVVDFIARHIDGETVLHVQQTGRMVLRKKYLAHGIHIAFRAGSDVYLYPHDLLLEEVRRRGVMNEETTDWRDHGFRLWPEIPEWGMEFLRDYKL